MKLPNNRAITPEKESHFAIFQTRSLLELPEVNIPSNSSDFFGSSKFILKRKPDFLIASIEVETLSASPIHLSKIDGNREYTQNKDPKNITSNTKTISNMIFSHKSSSSYCAAAPLTISMISLVMAAWRTRFICSVSASIMSDALLVAESIAVMRAACSAATDSVMA